MVQGGFCEERNGYFFGVMADEMPVATPWIIRMAVFAVLVTIVPKRLKRVWAIEVAALKPSPKRSATFWIGVPTALKRSEKMPLLSAIADMLFNEFLEIRTT